MHDKRSGTIWNILAALKAAGIIALSDNGYHGYDETRECVITSNGRIRPESQKDATTGPTPRARR